MKVIYEDGKEVVYRDCYPIEKIKKDIYFKVPYEPKINVVGDVIYVYKTILTD